MYKIYINETPVLITNDQEEYSGILPADNYLVCDFPRKKKMLLNYIDMLEKTKKWDGVIFKSKDPGQDFKKFSSLYKIIYAGGAIVQNKARYILFIFRFDKWDLPKGKQEKGEDIEETAIREIKEETGVSNIKNLGILRNTFHTYRNLKSKRVLKNTFWYHFKTNDETLTPQKEEGIEDIQWVNPMKLKEYLNNTYGNIKDLIKEFLMRGSQ